jgi:hypothetical protein
MLVGLCAKSETPFANVRIIDLDANRKSIPIHLDRGDDPSTEYLDDFPYQAPNGGHK